MSSGLGNYSVTSGTAKKLQGPAESGNSKVIVLWPEVSIYSI